MGLQTSTSGISQAGLVLTLLLSPAWLYLLLFPEGYDYGLGIAMFVFITLVNSVLILQASKGNRDLRSIMFAGLLLHYLGAAIYLTASIHLYAKGVDMFGYFEAGQDIVNQLSNLGYISFKTNEHTLQSGTQFVQRFIGYLFIVTGPTLTGALVLFTSFAYWGSFMFFRAYARAFPALSKEFCALVLFCFPSFLYWTSAIGKDAIIFFALGLTTVAFVKLASHANFLNLLIVIACLVLVGAIRPHIAGMMSVALGMTFLFGKGFGGVQKATVRMVAAPILLACAFLLVQSAQKQIGVEDIASATRFSTGFAQATNTGGSGFSSSPEVRLLLSPFIYFRPFPWEVGSVQTALAAVEGLILMWWIYSRFRQIAHFLRSQLRESIVLYSLAAMLLINIALAASLQNFGLLARQRTMTLPFLLILIVAATSKSNASIASQRAAAASSRR